MMAHTSLGIELLGDRGGVVLELLKQGRSDRQEVNTRKRLNLSGLK